MKIRFPKPVRSIFLIVLLSLTGAGLLTGQNTVTFAFLTDLHVSPGSSADSSLHRIVDEINRSNADFTVVTGDLTNEGSDAELLAVKKALDMLTSPCYVLPGNHETNWAESAGITFNKLWGNDRFLFDFKGYLFVGFNTGPFMKMGDGHVKQEDLQWIRRELIQKRSGKEVLISFTHYPLAEGLDDWVETIDLLKAQGCRLSFCGHGHQLSLLNFNGIPGIMGRSVIAGKSRIPGYDIVRLINDSVLVYNKELSVPVEKPAIAFNYLKAGRISKLPVSKMPDFSVNKIYTNRRVVAEWSDTASIFSGPCLVNDTIIIYGNSLGYIKAISTGSKKVIWQLQIRGPIYSTPVASDGIVVLGTIEGNVIGLDGLNGRQLWSVKTFRPVLAEGIIENGSVYIGGGDRSFYKIDLRTGNILWQFSGINRLIQGKPAISDSSVIFGAWDRYLYCLNKQTGSLRWKWDNGKPQNLYSPGNVFPVCSGNRVFIVAPDRFMTAIDISSGKEIWRTSRHQVRESIGISPDGSSVYAKLMNDTVISVSSTGDFPKTIWAINGGFGYEHDPCPVLATDELVIAGTRNGLLVAIDPETRSILWKYKAGNSSVNKVVADKQQTFWLTLTEGKILGIRTISKN